MQGLKSLLHCRQILYHLSHLGSPFINPLNPPSTEIPEKWEFHSLHLLLHWSEWIYLFIQQVFTMSHYVLRLPRWCSGKESTHQCRRCKRRGFNPSQEDPLELEMATNSSILAWKIAWTEEPGRLQYVGSQRAGHGWVAEYARMLRYFSFLFSFNQISLMKIFFVIMHSLTYLMQK